MGVSEELLRAILATLGRQAFPPVELVKIIASRQATAEKQLRVYNLCDGKTPQSDIANQIKIDPGNLSRTIARWIEEGIVIRVGEKEEYPMHLYPLPKKYLKASKKTVE